MAKKISKLNHKPMKIATTSLSGLAKQYGIHITTLKKWLKNYPEIKLDRKMRLLPPKLVQLIFDRLGEP